MIARRGQFPFQQVEILSGDLHVTLEHLHDAGDGLVNLSIDGLENLVGLLQIRVVFAQSNEAGSLLFSRRQIHH